MWVLEWYEHFCTTIVSVCIAVLIYSVVKNYYRDFVDYYSNLR